MANLEGIVCLNHSGSQAQTRCTTCMKPICGQCITEVNNDHFCSQNCAENHIRTSAEISRFKSKQKSGGLKKLIYLAILGGLIWFGWTNKDSIMKFFDEKKNELKDQ